jgi:hypothetical protein
MNGLTDEVRVNGFVLKSMEYTRSLSACVLCLHRRCKSLSIVELMDLGVNALGTSSKKWDVILSDMGRVGRAGS